jgi:hypothetical protein
MNAEFIKQIKFNRMKPEEKFWLSIFNDAILYVSDDPRYINYELFKINNVVIASFSPKSVTFYVHHKLIFTEYSAKFELTYDETRLSIYNNLEKFYNVTHKNVFNYTELPELFVDYMFDPINILIEKSHFNYFKPIV